MVQINWMEYCFSKQKVAYDPHGTRMRERIKILGEELGETICAEFEKWLCHNTTTCYFKHVILSYTHEYFYVENGKHVEKNISELYEIYKNI